MHFCLEVCPLNSHLPLSPCPLQSPFCFQFVAVLDSSNRWNRVVFVYRDEIISHRTVSCVHPPCVIGQDSSFVPREQHSILCIHHTSFIHSSVDRQSALHCCAERHHGHRNRNASYWLLRFEVEMSSSGLCIWILGPQMVVIWGGSCDPEGSGSQQDDGDWGTSNKYWLLIEGCKSGWHFRYKFTNSVFNSFG